MKWVLMKRWEAWYTIQIISLPTFAVEVNGNQYLNSTPIELWASSAYTNQTNIAIVVYEKYCKRSHINFFSWSAKVC